MWWAGGLARDSPVQVSHAQLRALSRVGPCIKFGADPACKADVLHRLKDRAGGHVAPVQRGKGERLALETLQMNIADARGVIADQLRRIASGSGETMSM